MSTPLVPVSGRLLRLVSDALHARLLWGTRDHIAPVVATELRTLAARAATLADELDPP